MDTTDGVVTGPAMTREVAYVRALALELATGTARLRAPTAFVEPLAGVEDEPPIGCPWLAPV